MNIILSARLLGIMFVVHVTASEETPKANISVWPPGSNIYLGESVFLQCSGSLDAKFAWTYRWFRDKLNTALTPNSRHLISFGSYSITGVTNEDGGSYWCQVEGKGSNSTIFLLSDPAKLTVSARPPPSLNVTPSSRQLFCGERFIVQCPVSESNSSGWILRWLSQDFGLRTTDFQTGPCSSLEGVVSAEIPGACAFSGVSRTSGLYWCEKADGRSNAINIAVSCNPTAADGMTASSHGAWTWITLSSLIVGLLFFVPLIGWLVHRYRYQRWCTHSCWPFPKEELPTANLPKTKQDVTEVQWDISWMEMSNLLDLHSSPGS